MQRIERQKSRPRQQEMGVPVKRNTDIAEVIAESKTKKIAQPRQKATVT